MLVLGVDPTSHVSGTTSLFKKLAIQGQNHAGYVGAGKWYRFNNNQNPHRRHATQSGTWAGAATGTGPTTFTTSSNANLTEYMVGWTLQPDINAAVYLTITAVSGSTLNVAGAYASLGGQGKRFRIYAPPGTERFGKAAGTLDRHVAANSSRHLYMGYRYESPAAGVWDDINGTALKRQTGGNFTGLYYTLHRHYDPNLMRFTSPDPAAQFFYNLHSYGKNSPARYSDPDGDVIKDPSGKEKKPINLLDPTTWFGRYDESEEPWEWSELGKMAEDRSKASAIDAWNRLLPGQSTADDPLGSVRKKWNIPHPEVIRLNREAEGHKQAFLDSADNAPLAQAIAGGVDLGAKIGPSLVIDSALAYATGRGLQAVLRIPVGKGVPRYNSASKRYHDPATGRFETTSVRNKVLRPDADATLYKKVDADGNVLKWGVTHHENPRLRYSADQIGNGDVIRLRRGPREQMLRKERRLTERHPGPENNECWAGWRDPKHPNYRGRR